MARHNLTMGGAAGASLTSGPLTGYGALYIPTNSNAATEASTDWDFGTGDFTIDLWFNKHSINVYDYPLLSTGGWSISSPSYGNYFNFGGIVQTQLFANQWNHYAIVRSGSLVTLYKNGISVSSADPGAASYSSAVPSSLVMGYATSYSYAQSISELRISKGIARWTANFVVPTQPYVADPFTVLLCHFQGDMLSPVSRRRALTFPATGMSFSADSPSTKYGSYYFNGSNRITVPNSAEFDLAALDVTIDTWIKFDSLPATPVGIVMLGDTSGTTGWGLFYHDNSLMFRSDPANDKGVASGSWTPTLATWYHVAMVRSGNTWSFFVNGAQVGSSTVDAVTVPFSSSALTIGWSPDWSSSAWGTSNSYLTGYIAGIRVSRGIARWTDTFIPPTDPHSTLIGGVDGYTKLMLHFDNGNNSAIFTDSSFAPKNIVPGVVRQKSDQLMFGRSSAYFSGSSVLKVDYSDDLSFGAGDFTVDFWVKVTGGTSGTFVGTSNSNGGWVGWDLGFTSGGMNLRRAGSPIASNIAWSGASVWTHIALVRKGTTLTIYENGISIYSTSNGASFDAGAAGLALSSNDLTVYPSWSTPLTGYIDELRVSKGVARWTANFIPPTKPYDIPAVDTYTKLLLHLGGTNGSTRVLDSGYVGKVVTVNNTTISNQAGRFGLTSALFNGTSSYLSVPNNADFEFLTGSFTVDAWVYPTNLLAGGAIFSFAVNSGFAGTVRFGIQAGTGRPELTACTGAGSLITSSAALVQGVWSHVAYVRSGNNWYIFTNGTQTASGSDARSLGIPDQPNGCVVGADTLDLGNKFNGHIQELRVSKGIARWAGAFAPPERPYGY